MGPSYSGARGRYQGGARPRCPSSEPPCPGIRCVGGCDGSFCCPSLFFLKRDPYFWKGSPEIVDGSLAWLGWGCRQ